MQEEEINLCGMWNALLLLVALLTLWHSQDGEAISLRSLNASSSFHPSIVGLQCVADIERNFTFYHRAFNDTESVMHLDGSMDTSGLFFELNYSNEGYYYCEDDQDMKSNELLLIGKWNRKAKQYKMTALFDNKCSLD